MQQNWKDLTLKSLPVHLNNLANAYRKSSGIDARPVNTLEDVVFLSSYLINRAVEIIRGALSIVTNLVETQPVRALRLQLSIALATAIDFLTRIVQVSLLLPNTRLNVSSWFFCSSSGCELQERSRGSQSVPGERFPHNPQRSDDSQGMDRGT